MILWNALALSRPIIQEAMAAGDTVIDATMGNGHDTLFLAELAGPEGRVYAFDIQQKALEATRARLLQAGMLDRTCLIRDCHSRIGENLPGELEGKISLAVFNLGYLPGGDHQIFTHAQTTLKALDLLLSRWLKPEGTVVLVVYHGGDNGDAEKLALLEYVRGLDHKKFTVMQAHYPNLPSCPPMLICIGKNP